MFPRLSNFHRLFAVVFIVSMAMVLFHNASEFTHVPYRAVYFRPGYVYDRYLDHLPSMVTDNSVNPIRNITTITTKFDSDQSAIVNPHNFHYIINPKSLCSKHVNRTLLCVVYIHSAPKNSRKRQVVRQTWGAKHIMLNYNCRLLFIMGKVDDENVMESVSLESNRYGDIMMEDFVDTYRNLTYKAIGALKWISNYCPNVTYVIKSDDDILIDFHSMMDILASKNVSAYGTERLILCNQWMRMKVIRDKKSKWYTSADEFPEDYFPPYCSGSVFIMSADVVKSMYKVSLTTKFFWVDDFYITGLLVGKLGLQHRRLNDHYMLSAKSAIEKFKSDKKHVLKFFHVHKLTQIFQMWKEFEKLKSNKTCDNCLSRSPKLNSSHVASTGA